MQTVELQQPKNSAFFLLKIAWCDCEKSCTFAVVKHWLHRIAGVLAFLVILLVVSPLSAHNVRDTLGIGRRILFSENKGQWEDRVLFRSQMGSATLFVERDCFTIVVEEADAANKRHPWPKADGSKSSNNGEHYRSHSYRLHFEGAATEAVEGLNREEGYENYYIGRDRRRWATGVGVYGEVLYRSLYEGIDMKVYAAEGAMKYDFIVAAGADPGRIAMRYEGVDGLKLREGNLIVATSVADIVELRPYAYQIMEGKLVEVAAHYTLKDNRVGIEVGDYDKSMPLIIDPYLHFSSYTGSTADNWGTTGCFDSEKNTYTSGVVFGTGYPVTLGAYDGTFNGNCDLGIFKFDTNGTHRIFATYLGGSNADMPHSMYVNSFDELVIFGTTGSLDFPVTHGAYDTTFNGGTALQYEGSVYLNFPHGSDIFISRLSSDGAELQASTYVGGDGNDGLNYRNSFDYDVVMLGNDSLYFNYGDGARGEIITDDQNNIYVGSTTMSTNFPVTERCIQNHNRGRQEGVVFKIDYNLSHLMWSTYLGGTKDDAVYSIDCDRDYNVVVCGGTNSVNFQTTRNAYSQQYNGGSADGFIAKISYNGKTLMASTYYGSSQYDQCYFVRCGKTDDIFIFGQTKAAGSTLIHNAGYNVPGSGQMLARFAPGLNQLVWGTVFGTGDVTTNGPNISPTAFEVDICDRVYLSGWGRYFLGMTLNGVQYNWNTRGTTGMTVTPDAYQSQTDGQDFYLMSIDMDANLLTYATFFGELHVSGDGYRSGQDHVDGGTSRFDRFGTVYQSVCASCSGGDAFPVTTGAYGQHNNSNNCNNAIFRLNLTDGFPVAEFTPPATGCAPQTVNFHNTSRGESFLWDFGDGTTSTQANPQHLYPTPGRYTVRLVAYMVNGCRTSDTVAYDMLILGQDSFMLDTLETCPSAPIQIGVRPARGCTYRWIEGEVSDSTIANPFISEPGTYRLVISNGICSDTATQIVLPTETEATIIGDTVSCSVPTILNINAVGDRMQYQWSSNRQLSDTLNRNMDTGFFSYRPTGPRWLYIHVEDFRGCYKNDSIYIDFYRVVDSLRITGPLCPGSCDGNVCLVATDSAAAPLQYNWGNGWSSADCNGGYCAGDYSVTFRDGNGCLVTTPFSIADPLPPTIEASVTHVRCLESCTGAISVNIIGNSTYTLLWLDDSSTTATRSDLCPGLYHLQITDQNGCQFFDSIEVLENVDMDVTITESQNSCIDACSGHATAEATGGYPPYTYQWSSGEEGAVAEALCEGVAIVVATDNYGCQVRDSIVIGLQHSFDSIEVWADDTVVFSGHATRLHVTPIAGGSCWWMPSNQIDNPTSYNPTAVLADSTTFVVTLTDSIGCSYTDSVRVGCISVNCGKPNIFIPNAFTPNDDGRNDQLCFSGEWVDEFQIAIFTRWGEKVYESDDINACWDGRYKNNWCMPGVYVYYCRIKCSDGQKAQFKGDVTLIR